MQQLHDKVSMAKLNNVLKPLRNFSFVKYRGFYYTGKIIFLLFDKTVQDAEKAPTCKKL